MKVRRFWEKLCRMCFWGWKMRNSYDWDFAYLYEMLYLKLDKMQQCMLQSGSCVWCTSKETHLMRKLSICRELARRLWEHDYNDIKWGYYYKLSSKNRMLLYNKQEEIRKADKQLLFRLLEKHLERFWD